MRRNGLFVRTSLAPVPGGLRVERKVCLLLDVRKKLDEGTLIGGGVEVLETNTFSDNHLKLATHSFEDNVNETSVEAHGRRGISHASGLDAPSRRGRNRTGRPALNGS
jgi:hypothetical protein